MRLRQTGCGLLQTQLLAYRGQRGRTIILTRLLMLESFGYLWYCHLMVVLQFGLYIQATSVMKFQRNVM